MKISKLCIFIMRRTFPISSLDGSTFRRIAVY